MLGQTLKAIFSGEPCAMIWPPFTLAKRSKPIIRSFSEADGIEWLCWAGSTDDLGCRHHLL